MIYMITWVSKNETESLKRFRDHHERRMKSGPIDDGYWAAPGVKVVRSMHVVGSPRGYIILEATNPVSLHKLLIEWGQVLELTSEIVISDQEAAEALAALSATERD